MNEEHVTTDEEVLVADDIFLLTQLLEGQRLPTIAEVRAIQDRFGMTHIPAYMVRRDMVQAGTYYFSSTGQDTPNKQVKRLENARKKANALLRALGDRGLEAVFTESQRAVYVEPPGLRGMLSQLRDNADKAIAEMRPFTSSEKQRSGTGKPEALRSAIIYLACKLKWYQVPPQSIYWYNEYSKIYGGEFFEFVSIVCASCGIRLSDHAIHDAIKKLHSNGDLPLIVDTEHP